jgi:hypothetical protein
MSWPENPGCRCTAEVVWIAHPKEKRREERSEIGWFYYAQMWAPFEKPTFGKSAKGGMEWQ